MITQEQKCLDDAFVELHIAAVEHLHAATMGTEHEYAQTGIAYTEARIRLSDALDRVRDIARVERELQRRRAS